MTTNSLAESLAAAVAALDPSVVTVRGRRGYSLSGVVLSDTTVITTNRAVQREEDISVVAAIGGHPTAQLVGRDPSTDLTLLRVEAHLQPATWEPSDSLAVGAPVRALGTPPRAPCDLWHRERCQRGPGAPRPAVSSTPI